MLTTLASTLESKKFVTAFLTALAIGGGYFGLHVPIEALLTIASPIFVAIGAQGWADQGKEAAKIHAETTWKQDPPVPSQAGFARLGLLLALAAIGLGVVACHPTATNGGSEVIDCTKADLPQIEALLASLAPLLQGDSPDWVAIEDKAIAAGKVIGGCAIAELVQQYLGGKQAVPAKAGWGARDALEDFRLKHAGGATFHTAAGDL